MKTLGSELAQHPQYADPYNTASPNFGFAADHATDSASQAPPPHDANASSSNPANNGEAATAELAQNSGHQVYSAAGNTADVQTEADATGTPAQYAHDYQTQVGASQQIQEGSTSQNPLDNTMASTRSSEQQTHNDEGNADSQSGATNAEPRDETTGGGEATTTITTASASEVGQTPADKSFHSNETQTCTTSNRDLKQEHEVRGEVLQLILSLSQVGTL